MSRMSVVCSSLPLLLLCLAPSTAAQSAALLAQTLLSASSHTSAYILQPLSLAYNLVDPLFSLSNTDTTSAVARATLFAETIDGAFVSATPTAVELATYPNTISLPYTVVPTVVIYNLPSLDPAAAPLLLSPRSLGGIFLGQVTWWNDSSIAQDNPGVALPQQPITVVLPIGAYTTSQILLHTLITQNATIGRYINASLTPAWPYAAYASSVQCNGLDGPSGTVLTTPYSVGYSIWAIAAQNGNAIAAQLSAARTRVTINATTIEHAIVEGSTLQIQQIVGGGGGGGGLSSLGSSSIDLSSAAGVSSWPMLGMEYVVLDTQYSRTTCHARANLVAFLVWLLQDSSAALVLSTNYFGSVPDILRTQLNMVQQLQSAIVCRGAAAASLNIEPSLDVQLSVDAYLFDTQLLLAQTYNYNVSSQLSFSVQSNPSPLVFDQQRFLEVDMGLLFAEQVDAALYAAYTEQQPPNFLLAPLFLTAVAPVYNRQLSPNITLPLGHPLNLTSPLLLLMVGNVVASWLHPLVLQYNPYLAALAASLPQPQSAPITQILPCAIGPTSSLYFERLIVQYPPAAAALKGGSAASAGNNLCAGAVSAKLSYLDFVATEDMQLGAVQAYVGAFAFTLLTAAWSNSSLVGAAQLLSNADQWQQTAANQTANLPFISPTPDNMRACIEGGSVEAWQTNLVASTDSGCWPMTTAVVAMLPLSYNSNSTVNECQQGRYAYDYLVSLYNSSANDDVFRAQHLVRAAEYEPMRQLIDAQVQTVTCDSSALLTARPLLWSVSTSVSSFGYALSTVGLIVAAAALVLVGTYLRHAVVAGAQPLLLVLHTLGAATLLISVLVLVGAVTARNCSFLLWAWNVGSTLTFAPLYAKVYRWYRMYGHGRKVQRVPNLHLYAAVALALLVDVAFTAAWQARAPLQPQLSSTSTSEQETDYVQCGFDPAQSKTAFLVTAAFVKGGALLLFSVAAFTVRRVLISYRENASVAYALYNTCFALLLLVPVTTLIAAIGDVLVALLAILVLWVAITPLLLLFAPKAAILLGVTSGGANAVNPVLSSAKSVSLGFSFLPVAAMSDEVLEAYIAAVEAQLADAKQRMGAVGKLDEAGEADDAEEEAEEEEKQPKRQGTISASGTALDVRRRVQSSSGAGIVSPVLASRNHI